MEKGKLMFPFFYFVSEIFSFINDFFNEVVYQQIDCEN